MRPKKTMKAFRLSDETIRELQDIAHSLQTTETDALAMAIHYFHLAPKEIPEKTGPLPLFAELKALSYRVEELEKRLREREELIQELSTRQEQEGKAKSWWKWWKV